MLCSRFRLSFQCISGEALGAIGDSEALPVLEQYSKDPVIEVGTESHDLYLR